MRMPLAASIVVVLLLVAIGFADSSRAEIAGVVVDGTGAPLPGVRIALTGPQQATTLTSEQGAFAFKDVVPGSYVVRAELAGFVSSTRQVVARAGTTERLSITLEVSAVAEAITVSGQSPRGRRNQRTAGRDRMGPRGVRGSPRFNTETYDHLDENTFRRVENEPLSTFSIDVDTASYANVRRFLNDGALPPSGAVRIEELINYFRFNYPPPTGEAPFSVTTELAECPWDKTHHLALIGLQGRALPERDQKARNLVFLIDVSGSMDSPDKLPLVQNALAMLADVLSDRDRVAIVVYAGASGLALPSTAGNEKLAIRRAIADLKPGGSTNGAAGITLAYRIATENMIKDGVNRVVLATDGDFNVGVTSQDELVRLIEKERDTGVFLSVLGVGDGNLKDSTMEKLADRGNGNYSYLDSLQEARKVLVREAGGTLVTIAKDVKIQIEFNPASVAAYRLIGYEDRLLENEDFNNDQKDAGDIGSGHSVTALYEIVPAGVPLKGSSVDPLRYRRPSRAAAASASDELALLKLRYKAPADRTSRLISTVLKNRLQPMSANLGFASAVAEFGMLLRGSKLAGSANYGAVIEQAQQFRDEDRDGYRGEFIRLAELAAALQRVASR